MAAATFQPERVEVEQLMSMPPRAPESERESFIAFKWLAITVAYALSVGFGLILVGELFWPSGYAYEGVVWLVLFTPTVIPLFLSFRHIHRWVRFESEYRRRHNIKHSNRLIEFTQAHPYWTTLIFGIVGTSLVYALRAVGVDVMPWR
jgi:hypothetical protein